jgi:hypothetical protein
VPLANTSVSFAGKPAQVGGAVARVFGWLVLVVGLSMALMLGLLLQWLFPGGIAGLVVGVPVAVACLMTAYLLLRGGRALVATGTQAERDAQARAIYALAQNRGGMLSALDVAAALNLAPPAADALLTQMAKETPEQVVLEIDDSGGVYFRFPQVPQLSGAWSAPPAPQVRVGGQEQEQEAVEVEAQGGLKSRRGQA